MLDDIKEKQLIGDIKPLKSILMNQVFGSGPWT